MNDVEEVVLDEYVDDSLTKMLQDKMEYPCVVISGVTSNEEVEYFRNRLCTSDACVTAYCFVDDTPVKIGQLELTLSGLLTLRSIFDYGVELRVSPERTRVIDLNDPSMLVKFIRL